MDYFYEINKWAKGELKIPQKQKLVDEIINNTNWGPKYALELCRRVELSSQQEKQLFDTVIKDPIISYNYLKSNLKLNPENRKLLINSVYEDLEYLGYFLVNFATTKETVEIIKNLKSKSFYKTTKNKHTILMNSIWHVIKNPLKFQIRKLLIDNGEIIFYFVNNWGDLFSQDELEYIYTKHQSIMFKQNKTTYNSLWDYCNSFKNFITFEKETLIEQILKTDNLVIIKMHYDWNQFNFSKEQLDKLECYIILSKLTS